MRNIICCLVFALESIVIHSMGYTINLETVKNIIRSFTVVIAISLYFAGWAFYILKIRNMVMQRISSMPYGQFYILLL